MSDYGTVILRTEDGRSVIDQADPTIGITASLLHFGASSDVVSFNEAGHIVICDQVTYRPVRFADGGQTIVCEQVQP